MSDRLDRAQLATMQTCACFHFRKISRVATQIFEEKMKPTGLRITQVTLLAAVSSLGPIAMNALADPLDIDRTTLTRNLRLLEKQGAIAITAGRDRRERIVSVTPEGEKALKEAFPLWQAAQSQIVEALGRERWSELMQSLSAALDRLHAIAGEKN